MFSSHSPDSGAAECRRAQVGGQSVESLTTPELKRSGGRPATADPLIRHFPPLRCSQPNARSSRRNPGARRSRSGCAAPTGARVRAARCQAAPITLAAPESKWPSRRLVRCDVGSGEGRMMLALGRLPSAIGFLPSKSLGFSRTYTLSEPRNPLAA